MIISLISCERNESIIDTTSNNTQITDNSLLIKKVRKLENPYSVPNMKKAYTELQKEGMMKSPMDIETTHLYIRFLPKDSAELETLYNDTTLTLFSYPLDYELTEGERYIDSTLIGNKFTWLYTRVPVDYNSSISGYEVLEQLYLPTTDNGSQEVQQQKVNSEFLTNWQLLEAKSLKLTGNGNERTADLSKGIKKATSASWTPEATIRVYDDKKKSYIPVPGVLVRGRWWFNWEDGTTDANGWTKLSGKFGGKLNWSIAWEGGYWDIRDGLFWQAYYNGPNGSKSNWNLDIDDSYSKAYAHVQRACWTMFYGNNLGASDQSKNNRFIMERRQEISVFNSNGTGTNYGANWFVFSQIAIHMKDSYGNIKSSESIYSTTIHELAHSFHIMDMDVDLASYAFVGKMIYESWASAVEWAVTSQEYSRLLGYSYNYPYDEQNKWGLLKTDYSKIYYGDKAYSPVFIDLIDNVNQVGFSSSMYEYPNDMVTGFTISELSKVLRKTFTIKGLKTNVKALRTDEITLSNIDKLFETYEKVK